MSYKELQKKAKELGIKFVGVKAKDLKIAIQNAEIQPSNDEESTAPKSPENTQEAINTAIIYDNNHEVRRYTRDMHGKRFLDMALEYAERDKNYRVETKNVKPGIVCPHCGKLFYPEK
jgi:signal recognition particle subunit SEC65